VRPAYLYPGVRSPLAKPKGGEIDFVVVRENTEGEYAQVGGFVYHQQPEEVAIQTSVFTRRGVERIVRFAFELAVTRNKKKRVTSITKSNAQGFSMVLWDRTFRDVAAQFPDVETESLLVDAAAMNFVRARKASRGGGLQFVCDILSDLPPPSLAVWVWLPAPISIRSAASLRCSSRSTVRRRISRVRAWSTRWQPFSAPHDARPSANRRGRARSRSRRSRRAAGGKVRTPDLGGSSSTEAVAAAVLEKLA